MTRPLRILLVHGVGGHARKPAWNESWEAAVTTQLKSWDPTIVATFHAPTYDHLFTNHGLDLWDWGEGVIRLGWSWLKHRDESSRRRSRDFSSVITGNLRWTAGMVAQWGSNETLRSDLRAWMREQVESCQPDVIAAHSLGSLVAYDTFADPSGAASVAGRSVVTFGSQIGHPATWQTFGGRLSALPASKQWYHMFNPRDRLFTQPIGLNDPNFTQVETSFDDPASWDDHSAKCYLSHRAAQSPVWWSIARTHGGGAGAVAAPSPAAAATRSANSRESRAAVGAAPGPIVLSRATRRALLVGISEYADRANNLQGCVQDVYRWSEALQRRGYSADDIRIVTNRRATAEGIRQRLDWLLGDAKPGDERFFSYSGHGTTLPRYNAAEVVDFADEALVPYDFDWNDDATAIVDDEFVAMYANLPYEVRLTVALDCCHAGGMTRGLTGVRGLTPPPDIQHRLLRLDAAGAMIGSASWEPRTLKRAIPLIQDSGELVHPGRMTRGAFAHATLLREVDGGRVEFERRARSYGHHGPYQPLVLMACSEREFAYEVPVGASHHGAFTYAITQAIMSAQPDAPLYPEALLSSARDLIQRFQLPQHPVLSSSKQRKTVPVLPPAGIP
jgi:hypothetical protein